MGSVERELLTDNIRANLVVLIPDGGGVNEKWIFPFSAVLGNSHLLRKLGVIETVHTDQSMATALVVHNASTDLMTAVTIAGSIPESPMEVIQWVDALQYLCATPSAEMITFICAHSLNQYLWKIVPCDILLKGRCDEATARQILTKAASQLNPSLENPLMNMGYDYLPPPIKKETRHCLASRFERTQFDVDLLRALFHLMDQQYIERLSLSNIRELFTCLRLMARTERGCMEVLTKAVPHMWCALMSLDRHLIQEMAGDVLTNMYSEECSRSGEVEGPFVSIECFSIIRHLWLQRPTINQDLLSIIPCKEETLRHCSIFPCVYGVLPLDKNLLSSHAAVKWTLLQKVPWLQFLDNINVPEFYVTGSLLTEVLVRPDDNYDVEGRVGDIDIFCEDVSYLDTLWESVRQAIPIQTTSEKVSDKRWKIFASDIKKRMWSNCVDVFVNTLSNVRQYYLPHLRTAFAWKKGQLFIYPSAAFGIATGVNIDFTEACGSKRNQYELLERKWRAGFSMLLNSREYNQFGVYLYNRIEDAGERQKLKNTLNDYRAVQLKRKRPGCALKDLAPLYAES